MLRLVDLAAEYEERATVVDEKGKVTVVDPQAQAVADTIHEGIEKTLAATGVDVSRTEVSELPANVGGQFERGPAKITAGMDAMTSADIKLVSGVLAHEVNHLLNQTNGDTEVIQSTALNEALTENSAADSLGQDKIAYPEHMWTISSVAEGAKTTRANLLRLYRAGENAEINRLFSEAANNDEELAAAA